MKPETSVLKVLFLLVAAFLVMPVAYEVLKVLMPLIFMVAALLGLVKFFKGMFTKF